MRADKRTASDACDKKKQRDKKVTAGEKEKKRAVCEPATSCTYSDLPASFGKCSQRPARLHLLLQVNRVCRLRHLHSASHHTSGAFA